MNTSNISNLINELAELNNKLDETSSLLQDEPTRRKIKDLQQKYSLIQYHFQNHLRMICMTLMDGLEEYK